MSGVFVYQFLMENAGLSRKQINVVFITDEGYAMPTAVAITSLKCNRRPEASYCVYVLCKDVVDDSKQRIKKIKDPLFEVKCIDAELPAELQQYRKSDGDIHTTPTSLLKFLIPDYLSGVDMALYLDSDVLIQKNIEELYATDIENEYAAVVKDIISDNKDFYKSIDYPHKYYFNSGMILLNLKKIREDDIQSRLIEYRRNGKNQFVDQDAFNVVFAENVKYVSYRYNFLNKYLEWRDIEYLSKFFGEPVPADADAAISAVAILHFGSAEKPWKYQMGKLSSIYSEYYKMSPYGNEPLKLIDYQVEKFKSEMARPCVEFIFPFEQVPKDSRVVLYGAGKIGVQYYKQIKALDYCTIVAWTDRKKIQGCVDIDTALQQDFDYVVITTMDKISADEITGNLTRRGVDEEKIVYSNANVMF